MDHLERKLGETQRSWKHRLEDSTRQVDMLQKANKDLGGKAHFQQQRLNKALDDLHATDEKLKAAQHRLAALSRDKEGTSHQAAELAMDNDRLRSKLEVR